MTRTLTIGVMLTAAVALMSASAHQASTASLEQTVRRLYADFNLQNADALVSHVSDDVRWMNVAGESVAVEASGREALRASMARYFRARPTVRARIEALMPAGDFVTVHERVRWTQEGKEKTQSAVAVYKFRNGQIMAVWYFDVMP